MDVSLLQFKASKREENAIKVEKQPLLQSVVPSVQCFSNGESAKALTLSRYELEEHVLQNVFDYN